MRTMQYKEFLWPHNPAQIEVNAVRDIKQIPLPYWGNALQDFGGKPRVITGQGECFGEGYLRQYEALRALFEAGGAGVLLIPGMAPLYALFARLTVREAAEPEVLRYSFEFVEVFPNKGAISEQSYRYHALETGDSLWKIAAQYDVSIETLLNWNPEIRTPWDLTGRERVRIA